MARKARYLAAVFRCDDPVPLAHSFHNSAAACARRLSVMWRLHRPDYVGAVEVETGRVLSIRDLQHDTHHADYADNPLAVALRAFLTTQKG